MGKMFVVTFKFEWATTYKIQAGVTTFMSERVRISDSIKEVVNGTRQEIVAAVSPVVPVCSRWRL